MYRVPDTICTYLPHRWPHHKYTRPTENVVRVRVSMRAMIPISTFLHSGWYQHHRSCWYSDAYYILGWSCNYYTFKHLNWFICGKKNKVRVRFGPYHTPERPYYTAVWYGSDYYTLQITPPTLNYWSRIRLRYDEFLADWFLEISKQPLPNWPLRCNDVLLTRQPVALLVSFLGGRAARIHGNLLG